MDQSEQHILSEEDKEALHHLWDIATPPDLSAENRAAGHNRLAAELESKHGRKFTPTKYTEQDIIKRVGSYHCMPAERKNEVEEDFNIWHPGIAEYTHDSCLQSRFDILLSVVGTTMSRFLDPTRPRNAFFDTNAFFLTANLPSSIDKLAIEIEKNSVWRFMK